MGEAKRRRMRLGQPIEYLDVHDNEKRTARNGGDPAEFIARFKALCLADERGERPIANVPCNGCFACCYFHEVDFRPDQERAEDLAHLDFETDDGGQARLRKREDGACIHLGDKGCTVYDHRPSPCRTYDCRTAGIVGMVDTFDGGRHSPAWVFDPQTAKARALQEAFRVLGMLYQKRAATTGESATAAATWGFALQHVDQCVAAIDQLSKLPPDQVTRVLGFDPRQVTQEDHAAALRSLSAGLKIAPPSGGG